jgi:hypothetical protein
MTMGLVAGKEYAHNQGNRLFHGLVFLLAGVQPDY